MGNPFSYSNAGDFVSKSLCEDFVGRPTTDSPLNLVKLNRAGAPRVNGSYAYGSEFNNSTAEDYVPTGGLLSSFNGHIPLYDQPSAGSAMATLLARTNPSRPDVVPLTLLQDLIDIPRQLKDVGRLIRTPKRDLLNAREVANQHLGFQFGWLPLIQDVKDLLDLQSHIQKRIVELHRLNSQGGLKRRIRMGRWGEAEGPFLTSLESAYVMDWLAYRSVQTKAERWGTVRWKPTSLPLGYTLNDADQIQLAQRLVLGLTTEATLKGAWDLIPWTWLIGWFSNISNFALQYANTIPARPSEACIMTQTDTKYQYTTAFISPGYKASDGSVTYTTKERYVGPGTLDVHLPFIDAGRLSILGSLFVQRFKG